jgi:16S rRNA (uracil1498-N3)-methyltransferase
MTKHRIWFPDADIHAAALEVDGEEARHALRVKRLEAGDAVEVLTGRGHVIRGVIETGGKQGRGWRLSLRVVSVEQLDAPVPRVELWTAPPKGSRLEQLIDQASQAGAASWAPLRSERAVVEPGEGRLARLSRVASESAKQSGRAWAMTIEAGGTPAEALRAPPGTDVVIADASGGAYTPAPGAGVVRLLIGPEGGWTESEMALARTSGARVAWLGPHVMRIETAAVAAVAIVLHAWASARAKDSGAGGAT